MSNTARAMSLRVSTNHVRFSVTRELGFSHKAGEKRVVMVKSSDDHQKIKQQHYLSMAGPPAVASSGGVGGGLVASAVVLSVQERGLEVAPPDFNLVIMIRSAKHLLMLLVKKALELINSLSLINKLRFQMGFEKAIIDCRFFTLLAVAGSLLGSALCFVEGCIIVVQSYMQYFHTLSHKADPGHVMQLLIEAIDMFLVGTAMLIFGVGLYSMFVGSKSLKDKRTWLAGSNLFGLFYMKRVPSWVEMHSVSHAKSKLGHALMMILQVGVLDKFKSVPLVTGVDLACFAGTVLISSACVFVLSKLSLGNAKSNDIMSLFR